jgi:hypothetical protein
VCSRSKINLTVRFSIILVMVLALSLFSPALLGESRVRAAPDALSGVKSVCPTGGDYTSLTTAIGYARTYGLDGPLTLELCASYTSDYETYPLMIREFPGSSVTNTVTVRPAADATGLSIASSVDQTILLDNVTYMIFDGRPGGVGSSSELTITNTYASGQAVAFGGYAGPARNNTLQYLTITGVGQRVIPFFPGSNENVIDHCDVSGSTTATSYLIYAAGGDISSNTLANTRLHRFASAGVYLDIGNTGWTITGNSTYQDAALTLTAEHQYGMMIASGDGYVIADNIIGGSQPDGGGAA